MFEKPVPMGKKLAGSVLQKIWNFTEDQLEAFGRISPRLKLRMLDRMESLRRIPATDASGFKNIRIGSWERLKPRMETKQATAIVEEIGQAQQKYRKQAAGMNLGKVKDVGEVSRARLKNAGFDLEDLARELTPADKAKVKGILGNKTDEILQRAKEVLKRRHKLESEIGALELQKGKAPQIAEALTKDYRIAMGEITDPAVGFAKATVQMTSMVENAKLLRRIADTAEWVAPMAEKYRAGFTRMPNIRQLGGLANRLVRSDIANYVNEFDYLVNRTPGKLLNIMRMWKFGKTCLNPATHFRNMLSNSILLDFSGVGLEKQPALYLQALDEMIKRGPLFQKAFKSGAVLDTFVASELRQLQTNLVGLRPGNAIEAMGGMSRGVFNKAGHIYQSEEQLAKMVKFLDEFKIHGNASRAAMAAQEALFNYADVPPLVRKIRESPFGVPFITFPYKAIPAVFKAINRNPLAFWKYEMMFRSIERASAAAVGLTPEQADKEKELAKRGSAAFTRFLRLPFTDQDKNPYFLDLTYILPWGDLFEMGRFGFLPPSLTPGGLATPILDTLYNKDFYGDKIWKDGDSGFEKSQKFFQHLARYYLPSLVGVPGAESLPAGFGFERIKRAVKRIPRTETGTPQKLSFAIFDVLFGLKARPMNIEKQRYWRVAELEKIIQEQEYELSVMGRRLERGQIGQEEFDKIFEQKMKNIQRLQEERGRMAE